MSEDLFLLERFVIERMTIQLLSESRVALKVQYKSFLNEPDILYHKNRFYFNLFSLL